MLSAQPPYKAAYQGLPNFFNGLCDVLRLGLAALPTLPLLLSPQPRNEAIYLLYDHRLKLEDPPEIVLSLTYLDFSGSTNPRRDKSASDQASSQDRSNPPFQPTYKTSFH